MSTPRTPSGRRERLDQLRGDLAAHPVSLRLRFVLGLVTPLGWAVTTLSLIVWLVGWRLGWAEMFLLASGGLVLLVVSALLTIGRARVSVVVTVDPLRVTVGDPSAGDVVVRNKAKMPLLPVTLELPIGAQAARFHLPPIAPGAAHDELFVVPTEKRGVVAVGPATTVRGDPFGLMRREVTWTGVLEVFVHPLTVPLEPLGAGLLRDLEGQTTRDLSMSDLAFHALRDYEPGDDRRYIHWRSSAKVGRFVVRQFLDTRRSHMCLLVDSATDSYRTEDEYELAISAAASLSLRALQDEQEVTALAGAHVADSKAGLRMLDTFSRAELDHHGLVDLARRAVRIAPDASIAVLVTGPVVPFAELRRAVSNFPVEVKPVVLRVDPSVQTGLSGEALMPVLRLQHLRDLSPLLRGALT